MSSSSSSIQSFTLKELCDNLQNDCQSYLDQGLVVNNETFKHSHSTLLEKAPTLYNMIIDSVNKNSTEMLNNFLPVMVNVLEKIERNEITRDEADKMMGEFFAQKFIPQYK